MDLTTDHRCLVAFIAMAFPEVRTCCPIPIWNDLILARKPTLQGRQKPLDQHWDGDAHGFDHASLFNFVYRGGAFLQVSESMRRFPGRGGYFTHHLV